MKVFIVAGEASGDRLGAALMSGMIDQRPDVEFQGVVGPEMSQVGMQSLFPMNELSLMGLSEILPKYLHLKRRLRQTVQAVLKWQPDVLITVDSPDFCLRVAKAVKAADPNIRTVHYVAPSVWAWRPKRAKRMAAFVDHVLALLPFEPPYMQAEGIDCDFVGHPIVSTEMVTPKEIQSFRDAYAIDDSEMVLAVLPGSRKSELKRLLPIFGDVLADPKFRNRTLLFPTLPHLVAEISDFADALPHRCIVIAGKGKDAAADSRQRFVSYHIANAALAASGTVSLELAAAQTPMVIAYDMSWLSRTLISRMLLTDTVTLVNLVTETRDIPEFIGANCRADDIIPALHNLFKAPNCQLSVMDEAMHRLGYGGPPPGVRAAKAILDRLG